MVTLGLVLHLMSALDDCMTEKMTSLWLAEIRPINRNIAEGKHEPGVGGSVLRGFNVVHFVFL